MHEGQPGYLRVDTVHQGDRPGAKGVYHINAVDEVTQWQIVGATAHISEAWLEPVLAAMLRQFPFPIRGFHSDNGSEFINQTVARLLNKLPIEQTKSRPRHSNDNGLVETKNGAVIRKHMGYGYIHAEHAERIQAVLQRTLSPKGFGRIRLGRVDDVSGASLVPFVSAAVEPGTEVRADGWKGYNGLSGQGYRHHAINVSASGDPAHVSMPAVHRVASLLKRWLLGTHQGSVTAKYLDAYLNEFAFRFNRRHSRRRGLLFLRLMEHAVVTAPTRYRPQRSNCQARNHNI